MQRYFEVGFARDTAKVKNRVATLGAIFIDMMSYLNVYKTYMNGYDGDVQVRASNQTAGRHSVVMRDKLKG